jgi:O-antigen/teichoic acid export membrane protein
LQRILEGAASPLFGRGIGLLVSTISRSPTVRYLGPKRYGICGTVYTSVAMIAIMALGGANSPTNPISRVYKQADRQFARRA